ncbi:uncharacterized protein [Miscanthus floridulus]|uniref:uncharacterized protein n=1 Tax=Miscanthus floridulus TaxID=154761 RepID=UPI003459668D
MFFSPNLLLVYDGDKVSSSCNGQSHRPSARFLLIHLLILDEDAHLGRSFIRSLIHPVFRRILPLLFSELIGDLYERGAQKKVKELRNTKHSNAYAMRRRKWLLAVHHHLQLKVHEGGHEGLHLGSQGEAGHGQQLHVCIVLCFFSLLRHS